MSSEVWIIIFLFCIYCYSSYFIERLLFLLKSWYTDCPLNSLYSNLGGGGGDKYKKGLISQENDLFDTSLLPRSSDICKNYLQQHCHKFPRESCHSCLPQVFDTAPLCMWKKWSCSKVGRKCSVHFWQTFSTFLTSLPEARALGQRKCQTLQFFFKY